MSYTFHDKTPCLEDAGEELARQHVELGLEKDEAARAEITFTGYGWFVETVREDGQRRFRLMVY